MSGAVCQTKCTGHATNRNVAIAVNQLKHRFNILMSSFGYESTGTRFMFERLFTIFKFLHPFCNVAVGNVRLSPNITQLPMDIGCV